MLKQAGVYDAVIKRIKNVIETTLPKLGMVDEKIFTADYNDKFTGVFLRNVTIDLKELISFYKKVLDKVIKNDNAVAREQMLKSQQEAIRIKEENAAVARMLDEGKREDARIKAAAEKAEANRVAAEKAEANARVKKQRIERTAELAEATVQEGVLRRAAKAAEAEKTATALKKEAEAAEAEQKAIFDNCEKIKTLDALKDYLKKVVPPGDASTIDAIMDDDSTGRKKKIRLLAFFHPDKHDPTLKNKYEGLFKCITNMTAQFGIQGGSGRTQKRTQRTKRTKKRAQRAKRTRRA